jgi:anti-sigma B factor antagonist
MRPVDESNLGSPDLTGTPADIRTHRDGDAVIITASGEIDLSTANRLEAAIRDAEETDIGRIVLDMSELSFLDSSALNVLLQASLKQGGREPSQLRPVEARRGQEAGLPDRHGGIPPIRAAAGDARVRPRTQGVRGRGRT